MLGQGFETPRLHQIDMKRETMMFRFFYTKKANVMYSYRIVTLAFISFIPFSH